MEPQYDSRADTLAHIARVRELLEAAARNLIDRGIVHDRSKLEEPEKSAFDRCTVRLKSLTYGSLEYEAAKAELGLALQHHYAANSHHPEHYSNLVGGMNLFDLVEMLIDWKAATERMAGGGDIRRSLEINCDRFGIDRQLAQILANTIKHLGW